MPRSWHGRALCDKRHVAHAGMHHAKQSSWTADFYARTGAHDLSTHGCYTSPLNGNSRVRNH
eukprot:6040574-Pyramimonas_sp.AAC.1